MRTAIERNDPQAVFGLGKQDDVVVVLDDLDRKGRHQQTRHSMCMAVPGGVAFAMHVIVVRLLQRGWQIGQFSVWRIDNYRFAAGLIVKRLLTLDVERCHDGGVTPDSLQVGMAVSLPRRFELRGLPERGQRNQKQEESHLKSMPAY